MLERLVASMAVSLSVFAGSGAAAASPPTVDDSGTRVVTLGTNGGAILSARRAQPANLLEVGGRAYLIDAGSGVLRQLILAGVPPTRIRQIFITHNHIDHNADWGSLMIHGYVAGQREPVTVYGPAGTVHMRDALLQFVEPVAATSGRPPPPPNTLKDTLRAEDISEGLVYADDRVRVTAVENCHFNAPVPLGVAKQRSYAYRFQTPDKIVVFSGDTGPCEERLVAFARGADLLVHEVIDAEAMLAALRAQPDLRFTPEQWLEVTAHMREDHSTPEVIGRLAAKAGVKKVVLSHVVPAETADVAAFAAGVRKNFAGPVVVAEDLDVFR